MSESVATATVISAQRSSAINPNSIENYSTPTHERRSTRGRPTKASTWGREKSNSCNSLEDYLRPIKRKRDSPDTTHLSRVESLLTFLDTDDSYLHSINTSKCPASKRHNSAQTPVYNTDDILPSGENMDKMFEPFHQNFLGKFNEIKKDMQTERQDLKQEFLNMKAEISTDIANLKSDFQNFKIETCEVNKQLQLRLHIAENKVDTLSKTVDVQDKLLRKNNILIKGLDFSSDTCFREVDSFLSSKFGVRNGVSDVTSLGPNRKWLSVKLQNWELKQQIMSKKSTVLKNTNITLNSDLTQREQSIMKRIRAKAVEEKAKGHQVKIAHLKLSVNGRWLFWSDHTGDSVHRQAGSVSKKNKSRSSTNDAPRGLLPTTNVSATEAKNDTMPHHQPDPGQQMEA